MEVKLVKLITGEDIICELEMTDVQVAHNPYSLAMHPDKGLVLMKFSPYAITEKVYLILKDMGDLSYLFCEDSRSEMSSQEKARAILGEDFFEPYSDTTNDVFNDVIEVLTPASI